MKVCETNVSNAGPIGVLLLNLGTPDAPTLPAVRRYLREFLLDPRVIDLPVLMRWLFVHGVILPWRPRQSLRLYKKIWTQQGSPLLIHSEALKERVGELLGSQYVVALGMRYGRPSIESAVEQLKQQHCQKIIILPLFPQYSSAATGSALEKALEFVRVHWGDSEIVVLNDFYHRSGYIHSLVAVIQESVQAIKPEYFIFSYHGLPERHIEKSGCVMRVCNRHDDCPEIGNHNRRCYRAQCYKTARLLASALHLSGDQYTVAFQSRLGRTPWIKPYIGALLEDLARRGIKHITIATPSFVTDCLETLEEIDIRAREQWQSLGGETFCVVPCLNAHPVWVKAVADLVSDGRL